MNFIKSISGVWVETIPLLKSKSTTYLGLENTMDFPSKNFQSMVPTYISICPICDNEQKWKSTGVIPYHIQCKKCKSHFKT